MSKEQNNQKEYKALHIADVRQRFLAMDQYLRKEIKYNDSLSEEQLRVYEGVREELYGFMNENSVDLYEVE